MIIPFFCRCLSINDIFNKLQILNCLIDSHGVSTKNWNYKQSMIFSSDPQLCAVMCAVFIRRPTRSFNLSLM